MKALFNAVAWVLLATSGVAMGDQGIGRDSLETTLTDGVTLQIELWYPSAATVQSKSAGTPDFLFSAPLKDAMVDYIGMPRMAISTKEKGKGRRGIEPAAGSWPLVIFSHGFASFSRQNNRQAEALAMAGYVVAAVSHPGESLTTEYADGRIVSIDDTHPALQFMGKRAKRTQLLSIAQDINTYLKPLAAAETPQHYLSAMRALNENTLFGLYQESGLKRSRQLVAWVQSLVEAERFESPVLKNVNLQRIALYGHSMGGVVSVNASQLLRARGIDIGAVVNLDAPQFLLPALDSVHLDGSVCFLMGGSTKAGKTKMVGTSLNSVWATQNEQVCEVNIEGAAHNNFTDLSWVSALKWFGQLGPIPNKKFGNWLNGFLVAYFDHHLKNAVYNYPMWPGATIEGSLAKPN